MCVFICSVSIRLESQSKIVRQVKIKAIFTPNIIIADIPLEFSQRSEFDELRGLEPIRAFGILSFMLPIKFSRFQKQFSRSEFGRVQKSVENNIFSNCILVIFWF